MATNQIPQTPTITGYMGIPQEQIARNISLMLSSIYPEIEPFPGTEGKTLKDATAIWVNPDDNNWQFITEDITDPKEISQEDINEYFQTNITINGKSLPVFEY